MTTARSADVLRTIDEAVKSIDDYTEDELRWLMKALMYRIVAVYLKEADDGIRAEFGNGLLALLEAAMGLLPESRRPH